MDRLKTRFFRGLHTVLGFFTNSNFYVKFRVFDKVISPPINMYFTHSACGTFIVNTSLTYNVLQNTFGAGLFRVTGVVL